MKRIMIVDDEPDVVAIVGKLLEKEGYEIVGAKDGEDCLEKLKKVKPDLILMDIMMPGMDGWEITKKIKTNPRTKNIPVAMLTVKAEKKDKIKGFHYSKCDGYLVKPIVKEELIKVVKWLLE
jgi:CheY-like chemotaxis protein